MPAFGGFGAQAPDPRDDGRDAVRPVSRWHGGTQLHQGVPPGVALAVERAPTPDGELELDHRLEPVDVGPFEESGLDQSHGPGRIASGPGAGMVLRPARVVLPRPVRRTFRQRRLRDRSNQAEPSRGCSSGWTSRRTRAWFAAE